MLLTPSLRRLKRYSEKPDPLGNAQIDIIKNPLTRLANGLCIF